LNIEFEKWIDENSFSILIWDNPSFKRPDGTVKPGRRLEFGRLYGSWIVKNSEDLSMK
jgi:hypothetical protein